MVAAVGSLVVASTYAWWPPVDLRQPTLLFGIALASGVVIAALIGLRRAVAFADRIILGGARRRRGR